MKRREFISASLVGLALAPVALSGCGGKKSPRGVVKLGGTVVYDGNPLPAGFMITFTPAGGGGRPSGAVVEDGGKFYAKYSTAEDGVEHGSIKVTIGWDEEAHDGAPVPEGFEALVKSYGTADNALEITVEKADTNYELSFPKK